MWKAMKSYSKLRTRYSDYTNIYASVNEHFFYLRVYLLYVHVQLYICPGIVYLTKIHKLKLIICTTKYIRKMTRGVTILYFWAHCT